MRTFEVIESTSSTNTDLLTRPFVAPLPKPSVLLAWHQTAGRGQRGKGWQSDAHKSLTFSLSIDSLGDHCSLDGLSLAVGLAAARAIRAFGGDSNHWQLKWPNDIVRFQDGVLQKLGGILIETRSQGSARRVVIGIGINVYRPVQVNESLAQSFLFEPEQSATIDTKPIRLRLAQMISGEIFDMWPQFSVHGFATFKAEFQAMHVLHGRAIEWLEDTQLHQGICVGVASDGALLVREASTVRAVYSAAASVRLA